jgi:hypothetical protein
MKKLIYLIHLVLLTLAAGCASLPKQAFDKGANANVRTIALLVAPSPSELRVVNMDSMGGAFGLIGATVAAGEEDRKSEEFTRARAEQRLAFGRSLTDALTRELERIGYRVVVVDDRPLDESEGDEDGDYSRIKADADAILDVTLLQAQYAAPGEDYVPWLRISARLIASKTKQRLYLQELSYGGDVTTEENVEHIPADPKYTYDGFDALMAKQAEAGDGLQAGIEQLARRVADQLR